MITAPIGILIFHMTNNQAGSGMGTSAFVRQFMAFQSMGFNGYSIMSVLLCHILLPVIISYLIYKYLHHKNWIKDGDMTLSYQNNSQSIT